MKVFIQVYEGRGIQMIVKLDDRAEIKRYIEHLTDLVDEQMSPQQFAEKWHFYMEVSQEEAEKWKTGVGRADAERAEMTFDQAKANRQ